jgi:serine/threonine protein kinase
MISTKKRIGKYILFLNEKLGKGAYSEVFKGVEEDTKEEVAVKVVEKAKI